MRGAGSAVLLAAIVLLGLALRLYRLDEQSLWWDDYNGLAHLTADGFVASMLEARRVNPEGAPLYHVVQWIAARVIGGGEAAQRLFNVALGVVTIPLVYAIGRNSFGARAGLLAALLFAMSPAHIFHAQSLRIYPLAMLLAAAALFSIQRMITRGGKRWLLLNALLNGALCLTHLFGLFAVVAQGAAAAVLLFRRQRRLLIGWIGVQLLCLLPAAGWVAIMPRRTADDFWHFSFPSLAAIVKDLFGDDLTDFALKRASAPLEIFGLSLENPWLEHPWLAGAMALLMMGLFVITAAWALTRLWRPTGDDANGGPPHDGDRAPFLIMLSFWAIPVLALVSLAYFWWPVVYPRYTLYACLGLYVLAGGLLQALPTTRLRLGMVTLLVVAYAYQLALMLPSDTRTQWHRLARDIVQQASPDDFVLVGAHEWPDVSYRSFCYHLPEGTDIAAAPALSILDAMEQLRCFFRAPGDRSAWYVLNTHYHSLDPKIAYEYLAVNGVVFTEYDYPAEEYVKVFHVRNWDGAVAGFPLVHPPAQDLAGDTERRLQALGVEDASPAFTQDFARAFERGVTFDDGLEGILRLYIASFRFQGLQTAQECLSYLAVASEHPMYRIVTFYGAFAAGDIESALAPLLELPREAFEDPLTRVDLELALWAAGEREAARASYAAHRPGLTPAQLPGLPLLDALLLEDDAGFREAALAFRGKLQPHGYLGEANLYRAGGLESWVSACHPSWTPQPVQPETLAAALEVLDSLTP